MMSLTPTPGSPEAIKQGCTCPVMDNGHGKGVKYKGDVHFWISESCPIHQDGDWEREE